MAVYKFTSTDYILLSIYVPGFYYSNKLKVRMTKKKDSDKTASYWDNVWGKSKDYQSSEEETKERAKRAAAASRRWREYSRRGADKPPSYKLPDAISQNEN
ncbi:hypothetical protein M0R45_031253 [Rubus argutus]|uniref:Uncharacterized protein n=1 Tax=Rubus argutus TaxID=59490 RepID=A0AAW1WDI8_RUBAR